MRYNGYDNKLFDLRNVKGMSNSRMGNFVSTLDGKIFTYSKPGKAIAVNESEPLVQEGNWDYLYMWDPTINNINVPLEISDSGYLPGIVKSVNFYQLLKLLWLSKTDQLVAYADSFFYARNNKIIKRWPHKNCRWASLIPANHGVYAVTEANAWYFIDTALFTMKQIQADPVLAGMDASLFFYRPFINDIPIALIKNKLYKLKFENNAVKAEYFALLPAIPEDVISIVINPNNQEIYAGCMYSGLYVYKLSGFYTYRVPESGIPGTTKSSTILNNIYSAVLTDSTHIFVSSSMLIDLEKKTYTARTYNGYSLMISYLGNNEVISKGQPVYNVKTQRKTPDTALSKGLFFLRINDSMQWIGRKDISVYNGHSVRTVFKWEQLPDKIKNKNGDYFSEPFIRIIGETYDKKLMVHDGFNYCLVDTLTKKAVVKFSMQKATSRLAFMEDGIYCWVPTYGDGIYLYDLKEDSLYKAPTDIKGYLLYAHTLAPDGQGNLLIPTNYGLFRINRKHFIDACKRGDKNLVYEYYDTKNGLINVEFNGNCSPAYNKLSNGDILFPSQGGLVRVITSAFPQNFSYPLFIESIKSPDSIYSFKNNIKFSSGERTLMWTLNYAQWSSMYSPTISYKVDDNQNWTFLQPGEHNIQLIDLKGGDHVLYIKNQSDLLGEKFTSLTIPFFIEKKYYERTSFWLLSSLLLIAVVLLMIYLSNKRLKQKNIELEKKVAEKTKLVTEQNHELERTLDGLNKLLQQMENNSNFQKKLMSIIGHDFMVPLQYISKVSSNLYAHKTKLSESTKNESINEINMTSTSLMYLGQGIIQWIKLQENDFRMEADYFKLSSAVEEIRPLHQQLAAQKGNKLEIEIDEGLVLLYDTVAIKIILHNLLINANKFTSNGTIKLKCFEDDTKLSIVVSDSGIGMSADVCAALNNMQPVISSQGTAKEAGWGLGYRLIIDLVMASKGTLFISSQKDKGTTVTITIPDVI